MMRILLGLVAALLLVGGLLLWMEREENPGAAAPKAGAATSGRKARKLSTDAVLSIAPGTKRPSRAAAPAPPLSPAMQEYGTARAYKPIHDRLSKAAARTAEESYLLAEILARCAKVTDRKDDWNGAKWKLGGAQSRERFVASLPERDPNRAKRIAAFDEINFDRCAGLGEIAVSEKDIRDLLGEAAAGGDPKARARLVMRELQDMMKGADGGTVWEPGKSPTITDAQIETLRQAAQSRDPYAVTAAMATLSGYLGNLSLRTGENQIPLDMTAIYPAITLLGCDLGIPCGPDSTQMQSVCAMQGNCGASDYRDYLFYYSLAPSAAQMVGEYQAGLARAVRDGDWSYFTFHRGPPPALAPYQSR